MGNLSSCVVYVEEWNTEKTKCNLRGAYFGYAGGGVYEAGFIRIENGESQVLDFSQSEDDEHAELYNALLFECGRFYQEYDGEHRLTSYGTSLIAAGKDSDDEDGVVYMDEGFDGDALDEISQNWAISLRFES